MSVSIETLYEQWERELAQIRREPDVALIASLEAQALEQGVDLLDIHAALVAAVFEEALHPRGHDGKFIEKGGLIRLLNFKIQGKNGQTYDFHGHRGKVLGITPDKKSDKLPPDIRVGVLRPDQSNEDTPATVITVKPNNVEMAPEKARLVSERESTSAMIDPLRSPLESPLRSPLGDFQESYEPARTDLNEENLGPIPTQEDLPDTESGEIPGGLRVENVDVPPGGDNVTTIDQAEVERLATEVESGHSVTADPPNLDDIVDIFADHGSPVDLTLLPPFDAMRDNGIPRSQMPQIPEDQIDNFQERLVAQGFEFNAEYIDPQDLKATQSELDGNKVGGIMRAARAGKLDLVANPMWVSSDGHILDGHHRWAAAAALSSNCNPPRDDCLQIPILRVNMPIRQLLDFANQFNDEMGVERLGFGETRAGERGAEPAAAPAAAPVAVAAAGTRPLPPLPEKDETGIYRGIKTASDTADGITDEDLKDLPHGDGSAFGYDFSGDQSAEAGEGKEADEDGKSSSPFQDGLTALGGPRDWIRDWNPDLHPRGRDGKFIKKFGLIKLFDLYARDPQGREHDLDGRRAIVTDIVPNPRTPGSPDVKFQLIDNDGNPTGPQLTAKPDNIGEAREKGRLRQAFDRERDRIRAANEGIDEHHAAVLRAREEVGVSPESRPWSRMQPEAMTLEEAQRRQLEAQIPAGATEEDAALLDGLRRRVHGFNESINRAADWFTEREAPRPGEGEAPTPTLPDWANTPETIHLAEVLRSAPPTPEGRAALTQAINDWAATVSTTDAEQRYNQLDPVMSALMRSILDTNLVNGNGNGRYTPERVQKHEEMYLALLEQIQEAGIPQNRDALALGGLPGAGKTFSLKPNEAAEEFNVVSWEPDGMSLPREGTTHVSINPDAVKVMMINEGMMPPGIVGLKPLEQATFLHEESSDISRMFSSRLSELGYNVVLDNTMDAAGKMADRMTPLAMEGYGFRGLFIDITPDESAVSVKKRYIKDALTAPLGGRLVPSRLMKSGTRNTTSGTMSKNRDAFDQLVEDDWFHDPGPNELGYMAVDNTGVSDDPPNPKKEVTLRGNGTGEKPNQIREKALADQAAAAEAEAAMPPGPAPPRRVMPSDAPSLAPPWEIEPEPQEPGPARPRLLSSSENELPGIGNVDTYLADHPQEPDEAYFEWQARIVDGLMPDTKHALLFETRERYEPVPYIAEAMTRWRAEHGRPEPTMDLTEIPAPYAKSNRVAEAFEAAPDQANDPQVQAAYEEFKRQSAEMWDFMTRPESEGGMGITVDFTEEVDPYPDAASQAEDLRNNHHVTIESGLGGAHELTMTQEEYDRFRAVHDVFGHAGIGGGFDRHGEYQAYLAHSSMYDGLGRQAMASEYHGVNTAAWGGAAGTPGTGKSILLPEELIPDPFTPDGQINPVEFTAGAPAAAPVAAAAELPDSQQLEILGIDEAHAQSVAYLAEQAGITPPFGQWYDAFIPLHNPTPPEGESSYEA